MTDADSDLYAQITEAERQWLLANPPAPRPPVEPPTIHFSELPEDTSGGPLSAAWNFYRREVGRLIAGGHEGRWVLIKGEEVVGIWDTREEADRVRLERFFLQPVLMHRIQVREPLVRGGGYNRRWR
jgi:hypothetical protein